MQINIQSLSVNPLSVEAVFEPGAGPQARILRARLLPGATVDVSNLATLEEVNRNATLLDLRNRGLIRIDIVEQATDILSTESQWNKLRNDVANAWANVTTVFHKGNPASITLEITADATDLATSIALANSLRARLNLHLLSTGDVGAHRAASAATVTAAVAVDLATAITLANMEKARFNTHRTEAGVHINNDAANVVVSADAVDQATLNTLATEIKNRFNAHVSAAAAMDSLPMGTT